MIGVLVDGITGVRLWAISSETIKPMSPYASMSVLTHGVGQNESTSALVLYEVCLDRPVLLRIESEHDDGNCGFLTGCDERGASS